MLFVVVLLLLLLTLLFDRVKTILLQHMSKHKGDQSSCSLPWDQVVIACAEHLVGLIDSDLWVTTLQEDGSEEGGHCGYTMVVPVEWLRAQADTSLLSAQPRGRVLPSGHTPTHRHR